MSRISFRTFTFLMATGSVFFAAMPHETEAQVDITNDLQAPPAPTNVRGGPNKQGVQIMWDNVNAPAVSEFIVYRLENYSPSTTLKAIATVPHDAKTPKTVVYNDYTTQYSHTYTYFLTSKDRFGGMSNNSKMLTVTTPAPPPPQRSNR